MTRLKFPWCDNPKDLHSPILSYAVLSRNNVCTFRQTFHRMRYKIPRSYCVVCTACKTPSDNVSFHREVPRKNQLRMAGEPPRRMGKVLLCFQKQKYKCLRYPDLKSNQLRRLWRRLRWRRSREEEDAKQVERRHRGGEAQHQVERRGRVDGRQGGAQGGRHPSHQVPSPVYRSTFLLLTLSVETSTRFLSYVRL